MPDKLENLRSMPHPRRPHKGYPMETRRKPPKLKDRELKKAIVTTKVGERERKLPCKATITFTLNTLQQLDLMH